MMTIKATQSDIEPLAALFAEGFMADPLYCHYIPYEEERLDILHQLFRKYLIEYWEELTVFTLPDRSAALCICPSEARGIERVVLPAHVQKVYDRINAGVAGEFYRDFLILDLLAVRPAARGKGIARGLVEAFQQEVRRAGKTGVAEIYNPANIDFYQRLGFRLAHTHPVGETLTAYLLEY